MELREKLLRLRKMSGFTQEQLAEKLNVSRQTISKWESGASTPDLESAVKFGKLFQVSLDDLLLEEEKVAESNEKLTMEDLMKINQHNRKMILLLTSSLLFLILGILEIIFITALSSSTASMEYMLYRYIVTGDYAYIAVDYERLLWPGALAAGIGLVLCICYLMESRRGQ